MKGYDSISISIYCICLDLFYLIESLIYKKKYRNKMIKIKTSNDKNIFKI